MEKYYELMDKIWRELCRIPAPSYHEEKRANYICDTLLSWGAKDTYIDEVKNVVLKIDGESKETVVFAAHIDTVFPDTDPMTLCEDEKYVYCPGCSDNAASISVLMTMVKYLIDCGKKPKKTLIFAFNSCEEGLGNLRGVKKIMEDYGENVTEFYAIDGNYDEISTVSVGSHRYKIVVKTEGGHAYAHFGNKNAAHILSKGISAIYKIQIPDNGYKTTYNVGEISGGTSVNSIVQEAQMLCEYRSVSYENLEYMKCEFEKIFDYMRSLGAEVSVELVGERPCMKNVDEEKMSKLADFCKKIQEKHTGNPVVLESNSTDCNIPLSMGIPAVCIGSHMGWGAHTREEYTLKGSLNTGLLIAKDIILRYFS